MSARPVPRASRPPRSGASCTCRSSAATTPSSPPTRGCAPTTRAWRRACGSRSSAFYGSCDAVLSPSDESDAALRDLGIDAERIGRWDRGVDIERFRPQLRDPAGFPGVPDGAVTVLYAGRLTREKGADLLASAFLAAREADPRLHLCLAGGGPEAGLLRERVGEHATFLGWLSGDELARAYATADVFLFASRTDTFGQVLLEAQASGLPIVAVDEGGPRGIVRNGVNGLLRPADPRMLADAVLALVRAPRYAAALAARARTDVGDRTWEASMRRLADGYRQAVQPRRGRRPRRCGRAGGMRTDRTEIAVAIHDVEPATFEKVALVRDWLSDHGIGRATLLVVPAPDLHPLQDRDEGLVDWLAERRAQGDAIAQHGLRDTCAWRTGWSPSRAVHASATRRTPSSPGWTPTRRGGRSSRAGASCAWRGWSPRASSRRRTPTRRPCTRRCPGASPGGRAPTASTARAARRAAPRSARRSRCRRARSGGWSPRAWRGRARRPPAACCAST